MEIGRWRKIRNLQALVGGLHCDQLLEVVETSFVACFDFDGTTLKAYFRGFEFGFQLVRNITCQDGIRCFLFENEGDLEELVPWEQVNQHLAILADAESPAGFGIAVGPSLNRARGRFVGEGCKRAPNFKSISQCPVQIAFICNRLSFVTT